jgi:hypothetical protein
MTAVERLARALAATLWPASGVADVLAQRPDPFPDDDDDDEEPKRRIGDPDEGGDDDEDEDDEDEDEEAWKVRA